MSTAKISRYPVPEINDLPAEIREKILAVQEKAGFVPNVFVVLAHRRDEFRAFFAYYDALMEKAGGLSQAEKEMIVVATSNHNNCQHCVVAHGARRPECGQRQSSCCRTKSIGEHRRRRQRPRHARRKKPPSSHPDRPSRNSHQTAADPSPGDGSCVQRRRSQQALRQNPPEHVLVDATAAQTSRADADGPQRHNPSRS